MYIVARSYIWWPRIDKNLENCSKATTTSHGPAKTSHVEQNLKHNYTHWNFPQDYGKDCILILQTFLKGSCVVDEYSK